MQQSQLASDYDYHLRRNLTQFRHSLGSLLFVKWLTCALKATHAIHPAVHVPPNLETTIRGDTREAMPVDSLKKGNRV